MAVGAALGPLVREGRGDAGARPCGVPHLADRDSDAEAARRGRRGRCHRESEPRPEAEYHVAHECRLEGCEQHRQRAVHRGRVELGAQGAHLAQQHLLAPLARAIPHQLLHLCRHLLQLRLHSRVLLGRYGLRADHLPHGCGVGVAHLGHALSHHRPARRGEGAGAQDSVCHRAAVEQPKHPASGEAGVAVFGVEATGAACDAGAPGPQPLDAPLELLSGHHAVIVRVQRVLGAGGSAPCQPLGAHSCALGTHGCLAGNTLRVGRLIGRQRARRAVGEEHTEEEYEANH